MLNVISGGYDQKLNILNISNISEINTLNSVDQNLENSTKIKTCVSEINSVNSAIFNNYHLIAAVGQGVEIFKIDFQKNRKN